MVDDGEIYFLQSVAEEQRELRRLQLIEADFDVHSQSRLIALGLGPGATCLEAGVGAGSMARWMCEQVGAEGHVVGVDLSDRYFHLSQRDNLTLHQADIRAISLPRRSFQFIHARCFMMHIPGAEEVLERMFEWLEPGGWVVLADIDFSFPLRAHGPGDFYNRLVRDSIPMIASYGGDALIGTKMPYLLRDAGFLEVGAAGAFPLVLPWGNQPEWLHLSAETVRPLLDPHGVESAEYAAFHESLPGSVVTGHVMMVSWGQRPWS